MGNDREDEIYTRLTEALEPVLKSAQQLLLVMVDVRVSQVEVVNLKATVARLEAMLDRHGTSLHGRCDKLDGEVKLKADRSDLNTLSGHAHTNAISVGTLIGGAVVVGAVTAISVGLILKAK